MYYERGRPSFKQAALYTVKIYCNPEDRGCNRTIGIAVEQYGFVMQHRGVAVWQRGIGVQVAGFDFKLYAFFHEL
jgi:hypothetical protein